MKESQGSNKPEPSTGEISSLGEQQAQLDRRHEQLVAIGHRVRKFRLERGLSQEDLGLSIGLGRTYIGSVERGEVAFNVVTAMRIADGLGVDVCALFPQAQDGAGSGNTGERDTDKAIRQRLKPGVKPLIRPGEYDATGEQLQAGEADQVSSRGAEPGSTPLVSTGAAARLMGVNRRTITRWVEAGLLSAEYVENSEGRITAVFNREEISRLRLRVKDKPVLE